MNLHTLTRSAGIALPSIQIGRGNGSKRGNFSTRGLKGAGSRTGFSVQPFFAGGQTSLSMRLPKLSGFKRPLACQKNVSVINLQSLQDNPAITSDMTISTEVLNQAGFDVSGDVVKILGTGQLTKSLVFVPGFLFSDSAKQKIVSAGGSIQTE